MFCKSRPIHYCAKCGFKIKSKDMISCTRRSCERNYHLICAGESDITEEGKESWKCELCIYGFRLHAARSSSTSAAETAAEPPIPTASGGETAAAPPQPLPLAALAEMQQDRPGPAQLRENSPPSQYLGQRQTNVHSKQVELYGLNKKETETEFQLKMKVLKIAAIIQFNVKFEHLETAFRLANPYIEFSPGHDTVVIVRFITRTLRNMFLNKFKKMDFVSNGMIDSRDPNPDRLIHAYENLKYKDKLIFTTARNRALSLGYKFCWTLDGVTYVRKDDTTAPIKISSLQKLDKYLPPCPNTEYLM